MAKNAAALLADLLETYTVPKAERPQNVRGFTNAEDLEAWRTHNQATDLVRTVDNILTGMDLIGLAEDTAIFGPSLPRWYAGVHFATTPWDTTANGVRSAVPQHDLTLLRAFGLLLDRMDRIDIGEAERRTLSDVLAEADGLLQEDDAELSEDVRIYLRTLIQRAQMVVNNVETYGADAVRQVALELGGALTIQAERAEAADDKPKAGRFRSTAHQLMINFVKGAPTGAGSAVAGTIVKGILGS